MRRGLAQWAVLLALMLTLTSRARAEEEAVRSAAEDRAELGIEYATVMLVGSRQLDNFKRSRPIKGAGIIAGIEPDQSALIWTASHVLNDEAGNALDIDVFLRSAPKQPIRAERVHIFEDRDLALLRIPKRNWAALRLECHRVAPIFQLSSETELIAIGNDESPWAWSRLNRFSSANDQYVRMETPIDRPGFSGGPVFTRKELAFVGIHKGGNSGIIRVTRVDNLPYGDKTKGWPSPSCAAHRGIGLELIDSLDTQDVMRMRFGFAQTTSGNQSMNPFVAAEAGLSVNMLGSHPLSLQGVFAFGVGLSYFNLTSGRRNFFFESTLNMGLRVSSYGNFVDMLWAPQFYADTRGPHWTGKGFRANVGRPFGDSTAGISVSFVERPLDPNVMTFSLFTDVSLASRSGTTMPGLPNADSRRIKHERSFWSASLGPTTRTLSDEDFGYGGVVHGLTADVGRLPLLTTQAGSLAIVGSLEALGGWARVRGERTPAVAGNAGIGLRLRIRAITLGGGYLGPMLALNDDRWRAPLLGWSASFGAQIDRLKIRALFSRQNFEVLYPDEPTLTSMGLATTVDL